MTSISFTSDLKPFCRRLLFALVTCGMLSTSYAANSAHSPVGTVSVYVDQAVSDGDMLVAAANRSVSSVSKSSVFQLFSHGKPGQLLINGQWMGPYQIAAWLRQNGLPAGATHLNIYGCEFAQGDVGAQAVKTLEQLLGLSVAASTNVTGQGGDWGLEVGQPLAALRVEDYAHSLQCTPASNCDGDIYPNSTDLDDDNDGILDAAEGQVTTATTLNFERIYATGGANYASGNYDVGTPGQYSWSFTGTSPTDAANQFAAPTQSSNDGIRILAGTFNINFANPVSNLVFSFSDIDAGTLGVHASYERIVVNVWDVDGNLLDADLYIAFIGSRVVNNATLANTFDGLNPSTDLSGTDLAGTLRFNFGSVLIDRIQITTQVAGASLRFQEPAFTAYTGRDTDQDGVLDHQDIDSDADGCPDAIEGGGNFTAANIDGNGRLIGGVQANGVPTVAGAGQSVDDSLVATQVVVNGANPVNQTVVTIPSAASFTISTTATNTSVFLAGVPQYGSGSSANVNTVYQWYLGDPDSGGAALTNTGVYSGATSATLGISNVSGLIGNSYFVLTTQTNHICTRIKRSAQLLSTVVDLALTKTNTPGVNGNVDQVNDTVTRGGASTYTIVVTNNGPGPVTGAVVTDTASGLNCTTLSCTSSSGSSCPAVLPSAAAFTSGAPVTLQALPLNGTATLNHTCTVN